MNNRNVYAVRLCEEIKQLREFEAKFPKMVELRKLEGDPVTTLWIRINLKTARNDRFPREAQLLNEIKIELPEHYPLDRPRVTVTTPIWNPNIFRTGVVCPGPNVPSTQSLAMWVHWIMKLLALDPAVVGSRPGQPANPDAARWYNEALQREPESFPTVHFEISPAPIRGKIVWRNII